MRIIFTCLLSLSLISCTMIKRPPLQPVNVIQNLQQGKKYFIDGYYKHAMRKLLPLACDNVPEAQYAVGYMYYYGLGVGQDTDVGHFWISRSAERGYAPAQQALGMMKVGVSRQ